MTASGLPASARTVMTPAPPVFFFVLMLPFGVSGGYATVTLAFELGRSGMATGAVAALMALTVWPQSWKVAWAPLVDATLSFKAWYVIGTVCTAVATLGLSLIPADAGHAGQLAALVVVASVASTLVSMASEAMMAHAVDDPQRGIASGWAQSGNLGGTGLGGGAALWLVEQGAAGWLTGAVLAAACLACIAPLPFIRLARDGGDATATAADGFGAGLRALLLSLWSLTRSRAGIVVILLMLLPIGGGAAQSLWAAVAGDWHAGAGTVALVDGVLGGLASVVGCVAGGKLCDRIDRKTAYCLFGLVLCAVAVLMALLPRTPAVFVVMTLVYAVVMGGAYAAYSAVVLEVVGITGVATKFQLLASASNVPIALLVGWDGSFHDWGGASGMLFGEAACGVAGVLVFAGIATALRRRGPRSRLPAGS